MKCKFCPNIDLPLSSDDSYYFNYVICYKCQSQYEMTGDLKTRVLTEYSFCEVYHQKTYIASFNVRKNNFQLYNIDPHYPNYPNYPNNNLYKLKPNSCILELDYYPDITPFNFYAKLSKLLAFL